MEVKNVTRKFIPDFLNNHLVCVQTTNVSSPQTVPEIESLPRGTTFSNKRPELDYDKGIEY